MLQCGTGGDARQYTVAAAGARSYIRDALTSPAVPAAQTDDWDKHWNAYAEAASLNPARNLIGES